MKLVVLLLAIFSEGAGVVATFLQLNKTISSSSSTGISDISIALAGSSTIGWLVYGVSQNVWQVIAANGLILPMLLVQLYLVTERRVRRNKFIIAATCGLAEGFILRSSPGNFSGWFAFSFLVISLSPQLLKAMTSKYISGISLSSQLLWLLVSITTVVYAVYLRLWPIVAAGIFGVLYSAALVLLLIRKGYGQSITK